MKNSNTPKILRNITDAQGWAKECLKQGKTLALVPTMGALHRGHLSLVSKGSAIADLCAVSIFVNPTQFGPNEDLTSYPRDEARDAALAAEAGAAVIFCPSPEEMYPKGFQTTVSAGPLTEPLCGQKRPGHFDGVATVVTKLLGIFRPDFAVFGQKDFQQLAIVTQVCQDLSIGTQIVSMPIVREPSGLAMSSRNQYLSEAGKRNAASLFAALQTAKDSFSDGERNTQSLVSTVTQALEAKGIDVEYVEIRDAKSLVSIREITNSVVLALAARIEDTRLIDNILLSL